MGKAKKLVRGEFHSYRAVLRGRRVPLSVPPERVLEEALEKARRVRLLAKLEAEGKPLVVPWPGSPEGDGFLTCMQCGRVIDLNSDAELDSRTAVGGWLCAACAPPRENKWKPRKRGLVG